MVDKNGYENIDRTHLGSYCMQLIKILPKACRVNYVPSLADSKLFRY